MKNKSTTYLLLAVVLLVWGLVFYKVFAGLDDGYQPSFTASSRKPLKQFVQEEEAIVVLNTNYRDPFLGTTSGAINVHYESQDFVVSNNSSKGTQRVNQATDWSVIDYIGIVKNKETNKKIALLVISGKEYMVNEKDVINGVTILKRERDSVLVKYNGEKRWIRR